MFSWFRNRLTPNPPERRATPRHHPVNAFVRVDGHTYAVDDLDAHHFRALDYRGDLIEGQRFEFHFTIQLPDGSTDTFPGHGHVIRIDTLGLAASFKESQPLFRREIAAFLAAQPHD